MLATPINIKPHHFVDILTSFSSGTSDFAPHPFGHAVHTVSRQILNNPTTIVRMELDADDICQPCMHNIEGLCDDVIDTSFRPLAPESKREYNLILDHRWCERLGIKQDDQFTAIDLARRIDQRMGDITDIYCENPRERTQERAGKLRAGIDRYLSLA